MPHHLGCSENESFWGTVLMLALRATKLVAKAARCTRLAMQRTARTNERTNERVICRVGIATVDFQDRRIAVVKSAGGTWTVRLLPTIGWRPQEQRGPTFRAGTGCPSGSASIRPWPTCVSGGRSAEAEMEWVISELPRQSASARGSTMPSMADFGLRCISRSVPRGPGFPPPIASCFRFAEIAN